MLEDLIVAATNEALRKVEQESTSMMSKLTGGMGTWAGAFRSDGILQQPYQQADRSNCLMLPGIGAEVCSAAGFSYYEYAEGSGRAADVWCHYRCARENVRYCKDCCTLTDQEIMSYLQQSQERPFALLWWWKIPGIWRPTKRRAKYDGVYHVLHGAISPMLGIGPDDIQAEGTDAAPSGDDVEEVIIATNSSLEGETTAMYISKLIKPTGIKVSRIASGVPVGGDLEYIDEVTLLRALEGRGGTLIGALPFLGNQIFQNSKRRKTDRKEKNDLFGGC